MTRTVTTWNLNPGRALTALAVAGLAAGALAGCGGSSSGAATGSGPAATLAAAESSAAGATAGSAGAAKKLDFTDAEACAWLRDELVKLKEINDPTSAQANIVGNLASFFDKHGGLENASSGGYDFDAATLRACPTEHDRAVKKAKIKSFGNL